MRMNRPFLWGWVFLMFVRGSLNEEDMEMEMKISVYQTYFEKKNFISFFKNAHYAESESIFFKLYSTTHFFRLLFASLHQFVFIFLLSPH